MEVEKYLLQRLCLLLLLVATLGSSNFVPLSPPFPPLVLLECQLKTKENCGQHFTPKKSRHTHLENTLTMVSVQKYK